MGILPQYGLPFYHFVLHLSMNIFHNSGAAGLFFCAQNAKAAAHSEPRLLFASNYNNYKFIITNS